MSIAIRFLLFVTLMVMAATTAAATEQSDADPLPQWYRVVGQAPLPSMTDALPQTKTWRSAVLDGIREALFLSSNPLHVEASSVMEDFSVTWDQVMTTVSGSVLDLAVLGFDQTADILTLHMHVLVAPPLSPHDAPSSPPGFFGNPSLLSAFGTRQAVEPTPVPLQSIAATENGLIIIGPEGAALSPASQIDWNWITFPHRGSRSVQAVSDGWVQSPSDGQVEFFRIAVKRYLFGQRLEAASAALHHVGLGDFPAVQRGAECTTVFFHEHATRLLTCFHEAELQWQYRSQQPHIEGVAMDEDYAALVDGDTLLHFGRMDGHLRGQTQLQGQALSLPHRFGSTTYLLERKPQGLHVSRYGSDGEWWWSLPIAEHLGIRDGRIDSSADLLLVSLNHTHGGSSVLGVHPSTGAVLWHARLPYYLSSPPLCLGHVVYVGGYGYWSALDARFGTEVYASQVPGIVSHILFWDDTLVIAPDSHRLHVARAPAMP